MPRALSSAPLGFIGANRSYWWLWPVRATSALLSYSACTSGATSVLLPWLDPEVKRGWCQRATVHCLVLAARSARSHCSCAEPAPQPPTAEQLELSATTCQLPRSYE